MNGVITAAFGRQYEVAVGDIGRARRFYEGTLGLTLDSGDEESALTFRTGDTYLNVYQSENARPGGGNAVAWSGGGDVEAIADDLRGKGVRFTYAPRVVNRGERLELWAAAFRDPDGHGIALTQWRDRPTRPERQPAGEPVAG